MTRRSRSMLRILAIAITGGLVLAELQACSDRAPKERASVQEGDTRAAPEVSDASVTATPETSTADAPITCAEGGACPSGLICCPQCCRANLPPVCVPPMDGGCPLPDLTVDEGALATKTYLETIETTACEVEEGCVDKPGTRKVLRFDASVPNRGVVDFVLGNPDAGDGFVWASCHKHYHFSGFAHYRLVSETDEKVVLSGRKQAFCARDSARLDRGAAIRPKYDCAMQGIQVGWSDIYDPSLPCQFLDVTDVPSGAYRLEIEVNPDRTLTELRYDNNIGSVRIQLP